MFINNEKQIVDRGLCEGKGLVKIDGDPLFWGKRTAGGTKSVMYSRKKYVAQYVFSSKLYCTAVYSHAVAVLYTGQVFHGHGWHDGC